MPAQKQKKNCWQFFLVFLSACKPKTQESRFSTLLILPDHLDDYHKIPKQVARK